MSQEEKLRKVIAAAVGASTERGDMVVVQSLLAGAPASAGPGEDLSARAGMLANGQDAIEATDASAWWKGDKLPWLALLGASILALVGLGSAVVRRAPERSEQGTRAASLSEQERAAALQRVRDWMNSSNSVRSHPDLPSSSAQDAKSAPRGVL